MASFDRIFNYVLVVLALVVVGFFLTGLYEIGNKSVFVIIFVGLVYDIVQVFLSASGLPMGDPLTSAIFGLLGGIFAFTVLGGGAGFAAGLIIFSAAYFTALPLGTIGLLLFRWLSLGVLSLLRGY